MERRHRRTRVADGAMIVERVWSARAISPAAADNYAAYFQRVVMPELAAVAGYRGARLMRRGVGSAIEIVVATRWDSLDAIRGFAGDDIERAVVHDEAAALFTDYDRTVRHFDIVVDEQKKPQRTQSSLENQ